MSSHPQSNDKASWMVENHRGKGRAEDRAHNTLDTRREGLLTLTGSCVSINGRPPTVPAVVVMVLMMTTKWKMAMEISMIINRIDKSDMEATSHPFITHCATPNWCMMVARQSQPSLRTEEEEEEERERSRSRRRRSKRRASVHDVWYY